MMTCCIYFLILLLLHYYLTYVAILASRNLDFIFFSTVIIFTFLHLIHIFVLKVLY